MLAAERENMLAAPPCNVEGAATLLAPKALTASPPVAELSAVDVTGVAVLDSWAVLVAEIRGMTVELSALVRVLVALAAEADVEVTVTTVLVTLLVTLPVAEAYSALNECSYRTC